MESGREGREVGRVDLPVLVLISLLLWGETKGARGEKSGGGQGD